jgi:hypothetical protein
VGHNLYYKSFTELSFATLSGALSFRLWISFELYALTLGLPGCGFAELCSSKIE